MELQINCIGTKGKSLNISVHLFPFSRNNLVDRPHQGIFACCIIHQFPEHHAAAVFKAALLFSEWWKRSCNT
jgi:hypothetical protein